MRDYQTVLAAAAIAGAFVNIDGQPTRTQKQSGQQSKLSYREQEINRRYNQEKAVREGRPTNYASLTSKQKAKYKKKKRK